MRQTFLIILIHCSLTNWSVGQTMDQIFRSLPVEYTPELTTDGKDSLLQFKTYTIPGSDSVETLQVDLVEKGGSFIQLNYYFTTGQRAFTVIELRKFQLAKGGTQVLFAVYSGVPSAYMQHTLKTFMYSDGKLMLKENTGLPEVIPAAEFLKPNIPAGLKSEALELSTSYNLNSDTENSIEYLIGLQTDKFHEWIARERIIYTWNGERFERRE